MANSENVTDHILEQNVCLGVDLKNAPSQKRLISSYNSCQWKGVR